MKVKGDCCQSKVDRDPRRERIEASYEDLTFLLKVRVQFQTDGFYLIAERR